MKTLFILLCCLTLTIGVTAQDASAGNSAPEPAEASAAAPDSLSLKERIFYYYDRSEFVQVVQCCNEALEVYQATDDLFEMAGCYNILGIAYQRLGRFKEAIASYQLTAETMEKLKESEVALHKEAVSLPPPIQQYLPVNELFLRLCSVSGGSQPGVGLQAPQSPARESSSIESRTLIPAPLRSLRSTLFCMPDNKDPSAQLTP